MAFVDGATKFRSSHQKRFIKKAFKIFFNIHMKTPVLESLKIDSANIVKHLRIAIMKNICEQLLLDFSFL